MYAITQRGKEALLMSDTIKIKIWVSTNMVGSKCERTIEVDAEEWKEMSESERDDYIHEEIFVNSFMVEWGYKIVCT